MRKVYPVTARQVHALTFDSEVTGYGHALNAMYLITSEHTVGMVHSWMRAGATHVRSRQLL